MPQYDLIDSFRTRIYGILSSYHIAGKIVVMNEGMHGVGIAIAQACVMVRVAHVVLVDSNESRLARAKDCVDRTIDELSARTVVHTFTAENMDQERITSIFFALRSTIGIPDALILRNGSRIHDNTILEYTANKSVLRYTTEDIQRCLYFNESSKVAFIQNLLAPGTKKRKTLINLAVVEGYKDREAEDGDVRHFFAHARKFYGDWAYTVHEFFINKISAQLLRGATNGAGWVWDDGGYATLRVVT